VRAGRVAAPGSTTYVVIAPGSVGTAELSPGAVTPPKIAALAVETAAINNLAVTTGKLAAGAVTYAKAAVSVSVEQTGTGLPQNVAHGLGAVPAAVLIAVTDDTAAILTGFAVVEGIHDGTNVVVTVTAGVKFKALAWA
jgi:uncharacterized membrane protein